MSYLVYSVNYVQSQQGLIRVVQKNISMLVWDYSNHPSPFGLSPRSRVAVDHKSQATMHYLLYVDCFLFESGWSL